MTPDTTTPATSKVRTSHRKTIFSLMGITLLLTCLFIGFAHGDGNDIAPVSDDTKLPPQNPATQRIVYCDADTQQTGFISVECTSGNTLEKATDSHACVPRYGSTITHAVSNPCGL